MTTRSRIPSTSRQDMPERPPIPPAVFMPAVYLDGRPYEDTELTTRPEPDDDAE